MNKTFIFTQKPQFHMLNPRLKLLWFLTVFVFAVLIIFFIALIASEGYIAIGLIMPREDMNNIMYLIEIRTAVLTLLSILAVTAVSIFIKKKNTKHIAEEPYAVNYQNTDLFEEFIDKINLLTPAEKTIFNYYIEGKTNSEILSLLYISLSTFKTHNSHIYSKLGISSRDELLLYIKLIRKSGCMSKIE